MDNRSALVRSMWANLRNLVVVLITFSSGLTALFAGGSAQAVAGITVLGFGLSVLLVTIAFPWTGQEQAMRSHEFEWGDYD